MVAVWLYGRLNCIFSDCTLTKIYKITLQVPLLSNFNDKLPGGMAFRGVLVLVIRTYIVWRTVKELPA